LALGALGTCSRALLTYPPLPLEGDRLDPESIGRYIVETFGAVDVVEAMDASFFFFKPPGDAPPDHRFPFATLVTNDAHDQASDLNRPGVFRLNIGVSRETYRSLFGSPPAFDRSGGVADTGHDYAALDVVMPHPVYAAMSWVCVLNPGPATFDQVRSLLAEAYRQAADRDEKTRLAGVDRPE